MKINRLEVFLEYALLYSSWHVAAVLLVGDTFDAMLTVKNCEWYRNKSRCDISHCYHASCHV